MDSPLVEAWIDFWRRMHIDATATLTFRPDNGAGLKPPRSNARVKEYIIRFFSRLGFKGNYVAVVEQDTCGDLHAHVLFESGSVPYRKMHDSWFHDHGISEIHECGERKCEACDDRPKCRWRRPGGGCGDFEYVARKMADDGRDGGAVFERMRKKPTKAAAMV